MTASPSRALVRAAILLALVGAAAAAGNTGSNAAHGGGSKTLTGKICGKNDAACVKCSKSGKSFSCLACSTGPVDAELNDAGRCVCPAGSALTGSKLTVKASGGSGGGNGKKGSASAAHGGKSAWPATCSECGVDSYAPEAKPVSTSRCKKCPTGTTTRGETGSATCYVEPGTYFDPSKPDGQQVIVCPVDQYCPGGDITAEGLEHPNCPAGSGTQGTTGNDELSDCIVPPGSYYNPGTGKVQLCDKDFYCPGGSVTGAGQTKNPCPAGSFTTGPGASQLSQCIVPPGSYYNPATGKVDPCKKDFYCPGGSVTGAGQTINACPAGSFTAGTGSSLLSQCIVPAGSYFDGTSVVKCPIGKYCLGGPVDGAGKIATNCPAGTTTVSTGSTSISQCLVPPGSYFDGTNVVKCPVGFYCAGGPVDGAGKDTTKCPPGTTTASTGSTSISQCLVPPGSYWDGKNVVTCTAGNYCTGGPVDGAGQNQTPCPSGQTSNPGASNVGQCFPICNAPEILCGGTCVNPLIDNNNCGTCGNKCTGAATCSNGVCVCGVDGPSAAACPTGSTCVLYGQNQVPTCVCTNNKLPAFPPTAGTCNTLNQAGASASKEYTVVPGQTYTISYDSFQIPDRYAVVDGTPCGTVLLDTGFTGLTDYGCSASAPCCPSGSATGCTGTAGGVCPSDPVAVPQPGGGTGGGTSPTFKPTTNKIYIVSFGVCASTAYEYTLNCP